MLCLEKMVKEHGAPKYIDGLQRHAIRLELWRQELWSKMGCTDEDKDSFKVAWGRIRKDLTKYGHGQISDGFVWLTVKSNSGEAF